MAESENRGAARRKTARQAAIVSVSIAAIALSFIFIFSGARSPRSANAAEPAARLDLSDATHRDEVASDAGLAIRLRERFSSQDAVNELSPMQVDLLAEQFGSILSVHAGGGPDDYIELMQSWGGTLLLTERDLAEFRPGWKGPDDPLSIKKYAIDDLTLIAQQAPKQPALRAPAPGQFSLTTISQFQFESRQSDLFGATKEALVLVSAETNGGDQLDLQYSFLWSPQDNRWIPLQMTATSRSGRPVGGRLY